jgi:hypothetical protein
MIKNSTVLNLFLVFFVILGLTSAMPLRAQEADDYPDADGVTTTLPDGTLVTRLPDQTVVIEFANTLRFTLSPMDRLTVQGDNNDAMHVIRSAMQPGAMSDGTVVLPQVDGALEFTLPDGATIKVSADNEVDVTPPTLSLIPAPRVQTSMNCTFTATRPANLRSGAGVTFDKVGTLAVGDEFQVIGQATGKDGFIWWQGANNQWVRSNLGTSTCPAVCGNKVCESGETGSSCTQDCQGATSSTTTTNTNNTTTTNTTNNTTSTGEGCLVNSCDACYRSVSCYPTCSQCTCSKNGYGCITCFCTTPSSSDTGDTGSGCKFASCEACIAAFPCTPGPCTETECTLNSFGCPVCSTGS